MWKTKKSYRGLGARRVSKQYLRRVNCSNPRALTPYCVVPWSARVPCIGRHAHVQYSPLAHSGAEGTARSGICSLIPCCHLNNNRAAIAINNAPVPLRASGTIHYRANS